MTTDTCRLALGDWQSIYTLVYYSHLIPVFLTLVLAIFAVVKTKFSLLSKIFLFFTVLFCLWLLGDVVTWTATDNHYDLVSFVWAPLDYINILFYLVGAYFLVVLVREKDVTLWQKIVLFAFSIPAWWITTSGQSVTGFNQPYCEAFNSEFLTQYKLVVEILVIAFILIFAIYNFIKGNREKRKRIAIVATALILFFAVFGVTEYISSQTGVYEINLYSLFVLPVFLFLIIYSITNLGVFKMHLIGSQLLAYTLIIMVGSQFFFLSNSTDKALTIITFLLALGFGVLLVRSAKREAEAREQIEKQERQMEKMNVQIALANEKLQSLDQMKSEFLSLASHQIRSPLTAMKGYASLILEGDYGKISDEVRNAVKTIFDSTETLTVMVADFLDVSRIEQGSMKYDMKDFDFKELTEEVINEQKPTVEKAGLAFSFKPEAKKTYMMNGDKQKLKQILVNFIDNSIKYTPKGSMTVTLKKDDVTKKIIFAVSDTGVGIAPSTMPALFEKFSRAKDAQATNIHGTGLGLYVAKKMVEAHNGRVWAESPGEGKGSTFSVELQGK